MATVEEPATKRPRVEGQAAGVPSAEPATAGETAAAPAADGPAPSSTTSDCVDVGTLLPALQQLLAMYKVLWRSALGQGACTVICCHCAADECCMLVEYTG